MNASGNRSFAIVAPDARLVWGLPALALIVGLAGIALGMREDPRAAYGLVPAVLAGVVLAVALTRRRVELVGGELQIVAGINRHRVHARALRLEQARVVDLAEHAELRPTWRTFGTGMPGYRAGHYRLHGGGKAFVMVTETRRVLILPERDGRTLLLSLEAPQALLDALHEAARR